MTTTNSNSKSSVPYKPVSDMDAVEYALLDVMITYERGTDLNKVILIGRLTKDPEIRTTKGDKPMTVARYALAVDRPYKKDKDQQSADFISCLAFGKAAEFAEKYLHKGTKICISGRIQTGSYTNKDGVKVYTTDVIAETQEFVESKPKTAPAPQNEFDEYPFM